jgi:L-fuculokinase
MSHIAVLDVGKTNKKILVYDEGLQVIEQAYASFPADESGPVHLERIAEQQAWFLDQLSDVSRRFDIGVISTTTHGATFVGVTEDGVPALPVIAYTTDPGEDFRHRFTEQYGDPAQLHRRLSTPDLGGLVCLGRGIAFARERFPEQFRRVRFLLGLPQYFGMFFTGRAAAECTCLGCHTYLWDFAKRDWSFMVDRLGIRALVPPRVGRPGDVLGSVSLDVARRTGLAPGTLVTCGIHDSNASLLPFLIQEDAPFVLNSTGTWCVAMAPTRSTELTASERARNAFLNCDAFANPIKTTIFMGGGEHDAWWEQIRKASGAAMFPSFDPALAASLLAAADTFIFPGVIRGTGPFPDSRSRIWAKGRVQSLDAIRKGTAPAAGLEDACKAYTLLNAALAIQTYEQLTGVGITDGTPIFVEGGFRRNDAYCALLASLFPKSKVLRTSLTEATALGAAILGRAALKGCELKALRAEFSIESAPVEGEPLPGITAYLEAYRRHVRKD